MSEPFLSARGLTKTYAMGKRVLEVLRGIDLDVLRGQSLALRGASGAGKSTLLHLIGGLDTPNAGQIHYAGQEPGHVFRKPAHGIPQPARRVCFPGVSSAAGAERA